MAGHVVAPGASLGALPLSLVVAATLRNGIGAQGQLPWHLPKDMAYFRAATSKVAATPRDDELMLNGTAESAQERKNAVIMGKNTWESIPARFRPLAGRINVVVSTTMRPDDLGAYVGMHGGELTPERTRTRCSCRRSTTRCVSCRSGG